MAARGGSIASAAACSGQRGLPIATPPSDEQARIADVYDSAEAASHHLERALKKCRELKTGLMQDLLTGRKCVTPLLAAGAQLAGQAL